MQIPFVALSTGALAAAAAVLAPDSTQDETAERPRLVVLVAVDQLIPEQLERLGPDFTGGFRRLLLEGTEIADAALPYARTETGAGHATFGTGCVPRTHGVVGNAFWDRDAGKERYCVEDEDAREVSVAGIDASRGLRSPKTILVPSLGEHVQAAFPGAKVCSVSAKDRAAIGMAGHADGVVLWWDKSKGTGFVSSNCYCEGLPDFVREWNAGWRARGRTYEWTETSPVGVDPEASYARWRTAADERAGERPFGPYGVTFPYGTPERVKDESLGGFLYNTPATDAYVTEMAMVATDALELGRDDAPDVLCVSYSANDVIGHANGPYSREVTDTLFRLDRHLGALFARLDERVGEGRWAVALTADHGVLPLPEHLVTLGVEDARRIEGDEVKRMRGEWAKRVEGRLGGRVRLRSAPGGYRLDDADLGELDVEPAEARRIAAEELRALADAYPWIAAAYSYEEVRDAGDLAEGSIEAFLGASFRPERTADVVFVAAPHVLLGYQYGTTHGSPHAYDRRIPLLFHGPGDERIGVPAGYAAGSHDVAPTMLDWLGIETDASFDGRSLWRD